MAFVTCPSCNHTLTATELQTGWCDECGKKLPSHVTAQPAASLRSADAPRTSSLALAPMHRQDILGWGTVRAGLAQVVVGGILLAVGFAGILALQASGN